MDAKFLSMFPFRYSSIFRSRWMAMLWAAGILYWAYDVASTTPTSSDGNSVAATDATGAEITPEQAAALKNALDAL